MEKHSFRIPGSIKGKQRAKASSFGGKIRLYTPNETVNQESYIKHCFVSQIGQKNLSGAIHVSFDVMVAIPNSWSKKNKQMAIDGISKPTKKPDLDNIIKLLDALNGLAWIDDAQIVSIEAKKMYSENPCSVITFWEI